MRFLLLILLTLLLAACGAPDTAGRATSMPYPTNAPATPGPSPTPAAYPAPAYPAPAGLVVAQAQLTAHWDSATSATIQWTQQQRGCLYKETALHEQVFIECVERYPATIMLALGGPETDAAYRPMSGDVYMLVTNGMTYRAPLIGHAVYLGVWRG